MRIAKFLLKCRCKAMRISLTPRDTNLCADSGSLVPGSSCVRRAPRNQQRCLRRSKHTQNTHTHVTSQFPSAPALIHTCAVRESQTLLTEHTTTVCWCITEIKHEFCYILSEIILQLELTCSFCLWESQSFSMIQNSMILLHPHADVSVQYFICYNLLFMNTYCYVGTGFPDFFVSWTPLRKNILLKIPLRF